ncbi:hypothetical protein MGWOODY_Clf1071 [hydrothermal vent metagenome]|uniref:Uncharacterized protein n=1 Tax=hydrothermal vent metagenome TaxID=652676 RepID=A0A160V694_9ZZZZ
MVAGDAPLALSTGSFVSMSTNKKSTASSMKMMSIDGKISITPGSAVGCGL